MHNAVLAVVTSVTHRVCFLAQGPSFWSSVLSSMGCAPLIPSGKLWGGRDLTLPSGQPRSRLGSEWRHVSIGASPLRRIAFFPILFYCFVVRSIVLSL